MRRVAGPGDDFAYSRIGVVDIFLTFLTTTSLLAFVWYLKSPAGRIALPLLVTGLFLGLSIATKWSAAYGAAFIGLVVVGRFIQLVRSARRGDASDHTRNGVRQHLIWGPIALLVIPAGVYVLSYLPFFLAGGGLTDLIALQRQMLGFHTSLPGDPPDASRWWTWPLDIRSVWFGSRSYGDGRIASTYAVGNPFIFWAFLPAVLWTSIRWRRSGNEVALIVLLIGFFGQWLPWILVERTTYLYHFLPIVPIGCIAVATMMDHIIRTCQDWRRTLAIEYLVLIVVAFIFFYPIYSYYPLSEFQQDLRLWFPSWR